MPRKMSKRRVKSPRQGEGGLMPKSSKMQSRYAKKGPKS